MDFLTDAQRQCYEKITPWMQELFTNHLKVDEEAPLFHVISGSAYAIVQVVPWGEQDSTITTRAYVVSGAALTPELQLFLLQENDTMRFGAFGIDEDGDIVLHYSIVGSTCDKNELEEAVTAVVTTADRYDEQIAKQWGGKPALL